MDNKYVEEKSTDEIIDAIENDQNAVPYSPLSSFPRLGAVVPLNLSGETLQAQLDFSEDVPNIDDFLVEKLRFSSKFNLATGNGAENGGLSAEQADAVAFAIRQIEKGKGMILGDMAGLGKGRINACILRYAYVNGYLPIFITESPSLFSAIYRDLTDIGGIKTKNGKNDSGKPFILNGYKSGGFDKGYDEEGRKTKIKRPSETGIVKDGKEIFTAPKQDFISQVLDTDKMPKGFDYLFLTYSQISTKKRNKIDYILRLAQKNKIIVCLDECHNASGTTSTTGQRMIELLNASSGVLFSSATFSNRPDNMFLYSQKTDIIESPLGTEKLIEVIKKGGERLIENLASNLVSCGQMLRRERTYENCDVVYNYMSDEYKEKLFVKYDNALRLYKTLQSYFNEKNTRFRDAKIKAIERFAKENKVEVIFEEKPIDKLELKEWQKKNNGKYYVKTFTAGDIKRNKFQFIETLLFAIKAEFVVEQVVGNVEKRTLGQLNDNKLENLTTGDKVKFQSNRKPVIAVRNTLEGTYYALGLEVGAELDKADFSMYVYALALNAIEGVCTLKQIKIDDEDDEKGKTISDDLLITENDFEDGGESYKKILDGIKNVDLDIPLSPIDYIIQRIENVKRPYWDMDYGDGSEYFRVGEVTGRTFNLFQLKDEKGNFINKWKLFLNKRDKNKSVTFGKFNNGTIDVLLINESGSTGEDAHSAGKFKDRRPRVMIIHQVELNVNTEVQKRGRINRTGMVNYPTYVYAISRIPSEIRRLLMLVRKLRSLDANTTGNQKQSQKLSTIRDSEGNEIEDIINKYGDECLEEFLNDVSNQKYNVYKGENQRRFDDLIIETFIRNLEFAFCTDQEYFFNTINILYKKLKEELLESGMYDLETNLVNLKAVIKTRVEISKGKDSNPFNSPVYEEDDYVLAQDKPYTKEKVEDLVLKLSEGKDAVEYYDNFVKDYKKYYEKHIQEIVDGIEKPDYEGLDKEDRKKLKQEFEEKIIQIKKRAEDDYKTVLNVIDAKKITTKDTFDIHQDPSKQSYIKTIRYMTDSNVFDIVDNEEGKWYLVEEGWILATDVKSEDKILVPNNPVLIPANLDECYETDEDGNEIIPQNYNSARFVGIRLLKTAKEKYSPMNIELIFCQLSGRPKLILKPTAKGRAVLDWVLLKSKYIEKTRRILIENWQIDLNRREIIRLLTGNILGAYSFAVERVKGDNYSPIIKFLKFTTADNTSIRLGLKLTMDNFRNLEPEEVEIEYPINSPDFVNDLMKTQDYITTRNLNENFYLTKNNQNNRELVEIFIFGGKLQNPESPKKRAYFNSMYYDGEIFNLVQNSKSLKIELAYELNYKPTGSKTKVKVRTLRISGNLNENSAEEFKNIFSYIYTKESFNLKLTGIEGEKTIYDKPDIYLADVDVEEEVQGEYKYDSVLPFTSIKESIRNFNKFDKYDKTSDFGTIYLNRRANVNEAINYGLIPLDNTLKDMVSDTFQIITNDTDRLNFKQSIEKYISEKKSNFEIGKMVYDVLNRRIPNLNTIFGYEGDDLNFIGEVFIKYAKGEVDLPKKEEKPEEIKRERPKRELNIDTAQEYMTYLYYKIKKTN